MQRLWKQMVLRFGLLPLDVQYQNATIWGKLITNFAGPMNNFILGVVVFGF